MGYEYRNVIFFYNSCYIFSKEYLNILFDKRDLNEMDFLGFY